MVLMDYGLHTHDNFKIYNALGNIFMKVACLIVEK